MAAPEQDEQLEKGQWPSPVKTATLRARNHRGGGQVEIEGRMGQGKGERGDQGMRKELRKLKTYP